MPAEVKEERAATIMQTQQAISLAHNEAKVGQTLPVVIDRAEHGYWYGRTEQDSPEVDNEVVIAMQDDMHLPIGDVVQVHITEAEDYDLFGEVVTAG